MNHHEKILLNFENIHIFILLGITNCYSDNQYYKYITKFMKHELKILYTKINNYYLFFANMENNDLKIDDCEFMEINNFIENEKIKDVLFIIRCGYYGKMCNALIFTKKNIINYYSIETKIFFSNDIFYSFEHDLLLIEFKSKTNKDCTSIDKLSLIDTHTNFMKNINMSEQEYELYLKNKEEIKNIYDNIIKNNCIVSIKRINNFSDVLFITNA